MVTGDYQYFRSRVELWLPIHLPLIVACRAEHQYDIAPVINLDDCGHDAAEDLICDYLGLFIEFLSTQTVRPKVLFVQST